MGSQRDIRYGVNLESQTIVIEMLDNYIHSRQILW